MRISKSIIAYKQAHPNCEACGRPAMAWPHHIVSRGSGGTDDVTNLLSLCSHCHRSYHNDGVGTFILRNPQLKAKIVAARPWALHKLYYSTGAGGQPPSPGTTF